MHRDEAVGGGEEGRENRQGDPVLTLLLAGIDERLVRWIRPLRVVESDLTPRHHHEAERLGQEVERAPRRGAQFGLGPSRYDQRADERAARRERRLGKGQRIEGSPGRFVLRDGQLGRGDQERQNEEIRSA